MKNIKIIKIGGMTCANCAKGIQKQLEEKGVTKIKVNFVTSEASFIADSFTTNQIKKFITDLGYKVLDQKIDENKFSLEEKLFLFNLIFTIPLFAHMFLSSDHILHNPLVQFLLCLPVYISGTWFFGKSALSSFRNHTLNMDVLITIGSSSAFIYSVLGWYLNLGHSYLFFETSATIITLVLLGNVFEHRSVKRTTTSIKELSKIQFTNAKREKNGEIEDVNYEEIKVNDILIVNTGDKIPADSIIIDGEGTIDESMVTGESIPVFKLEGNKVIGGTILLSGNIKIKAENVGSDTLISRIILLVKDAQNNKPKIQKLGDQVSAVFVPIVVAISLLTFLGSFYLFNIDLKYAFLRSIAVLVIACPCAMGLATPTAVMVGIGRAARNGVLIKGGNTLEKLAKITHLVFDKTGTITTGDFKIKEFNIIDGKDQEIKNIVFNLEKKSSHPIALSLVKELARNCENIELKNIKERKGISMECSFKDDKYVVGSNRILNDSFEQHDLYITKNKKLIGWIDIEDQVKENTQEVIKRINAMNISTSLLSGDKKRKCENLALRLPFTHVYSEQLPDEKLKKISELSKNEQTAMIGDGINDAPALSQATVGISLGGASQVAIESSEIILLNKKNLSQLIEALSISKHTFLTIKQNLFWAFSYNIIAIPMAIMGKIEPMSAALFMAFSDVIVIGNSIRLKTKKLN